MSQPAFSSSARGMPNSGLPSGFSFRKKPETRPPSCEITPYGWPPLVACTQVETVNDWSVGSVSGTETYWLLPSSRSVRPSYTASGLPQIHQFSAMST